MTVVSFSICFHAETYSSSKEILAKPLELPQPLEEQDTTHMNGKDEVIVCYWTIKLFYFCIIFHSVDNDVVKEEFPCLVLDEMADWEQKALKQKLHDEYRAIRNKFDILVLSTQSELKSSSCCTPEHLKESALFQDLACSLNALEHADNFDSIFTVLKKNYCWTWFHFEILKDIITLCLPDGFQKFDDYNKDFETYCRRSLFECPKEIGKYSNNYSNPLFFKVDDKVFKNSYINQYRRDFETALVTILNIKRNLVLLTYDKGCTQLVYSLQISEARRAFPLSQKQKERLAKIGVKECYLITDQDAKVKYKLHEVIMQCVFINFVIKCTHVHAMFSSLQKLNFEEVSYSADATVHLLPPSMSAVNNSLGGVSKSGKIAEKATTAKEAIKNPLDIFEEEWKKVNEVIAEEQERLANKPEKVTAEFNEKQSAEEMKVKKINEMVQELRDDLENSSSHEEELGNKHNELLKAKIQLKKIIDKCEESIISFTTALKASDEMLRYSTDEIEPVTRGLRDIINAINHSVNQLQKELKLTTENIKRLESKIQDLSHVVGVGTAVVPAGAVVVAAAVRASAGVATGITIGAYVGSMIVPVAGDVVGGIIIVGGVVGGTAGFAVGLVDGMTAYLWGSQNERQEQQLKRQTEKKEMLQQQLDKQRTQLHLWENTHQRVEQQLAALKELNVFDLL